MSKNALFQLFWLFRVFRILSYTYGNHAISCGRQGERIARHDHLRDTIFFTVASANLSPSKEDCALLPGTEERPADVMLQNFAGGLHAALDISVINPLQALTIQRAAEEPGYAMNLRHQQKLTKYGDRTTGA